MLARFSANPGHARSWRRGRLTALVLLAAGAIPLAAHATAEEPQMAWSSQVGEPVYSSLRVSGDRIYLTSVQPTGPNVFALGTGNGKVIWRFATKGSIGIPPTVGGTQLFVASDIGQTHYMRAIDAKTGALVWDYTRNQPPECMCSYASHLQSGLLFAQTDGHSLYAFDPASGSVPSRRIWEFKGDGALLTSPVTAAGEVTFGSADHRIYALDAKTGAIRWTATTGYSFAARPVIVGDAVIAGNLGGTLHAYDLKTGRSLWSFGTNGALDTAPAVRGGTLFLASEDLNVYAIDARTGTQVWSRGMEDYSAFRPLVHGSEVIVANRAGELLAFDAADGHTVWTADLDGTPFSAPLAWKGDVVLKIGDHAIGAFSAASGKPVWRYRSKAVLTPPAAGASAVYTASSDGRVIAFE